MRIALSVRCVVMISAGLSPAVVTRLLLISSSIGSLVGCVKHVLLVLHARWMGRLVGTVYVVCTSQLTSRLELAHDSMSHTHRTDSFDRLFSHALYGANIPRCCTHLCTRRCTCETHLNLTEPTRAACTVSCNSLIWSARKDERENAITASGDDMGAKALAYGCGGRPERRKPVCGSRPSNGLGGNGCVPA